MSMDTFSEKSGISKAYISILEKNKHPKTGKPIAPSIGTIKQAADGMGLDFNVLFNMIDGDVDLSSSSISASPMDQCSSDPVPSGLRIDEQALLRNYNQLNDAGKEKALEYVEDLTGNSKYASGSFEPAKKEMA
ncbi:MAG: helix-turn-helix transcriptional regulator [Blautia sp.]|nr:helix-turn-helix transcriptional regulator [Blautia sp.]